MQILSIRDANGCHCRRCLWQINHIKISKPPMFRQKKKFGLCNFFRASKICLLPALWACDLKNFLGRLQITRAHACNYCTQGKFRPYFHSLALWPDCEFKTGLIEWNINDYVKNWRVYEFKTGWISLGSLFGKIGLGEFKAVYRGFQFLNWI